MVDVSVKTDKDLTLIRKIKKTEATGKTLSISINLPKTSKTPILFFLNHLIEKMNEKQVKYEML